MRQNRYAMICPVNNNCFPIEKRCPMVLISNSLRFTLLKVPGQSFLCLNDILLQLDVIQ